MRALAARPGPGKGTRQEIDYSKTEKVHKLGLTYPQDVIDACDSRYYKLAGNNASHFVNGKTGDAAKPMADRVGAAPDPSKDFELAGIRFPPRPKNAIEGYRYYHLRAIMEAATAGQKGGTVDSSLATEAFGAHYLTDCFAAGHQRTERQSIKDYWDGKVPMFFYNLKGYMAEEVARRVAAGMSWGGMQVRDDVAYDPPVGDGAKQIVGQKLDAIGPLGLGDLVSGAIHDYDNHHGLKATSNGADVTLYGDNSAGKGDEQNLAIKAVAAGWADLQNAFKAGGGGKTPQEVIDSLVGADELFHPERYIPKAKPDDQQGADQKKTKWDYATLDGLLGDAQFGAGAKIFAAEKAATIKEVVGSFDAAKKKAVEDGIIAPLVSDPIGVVRGVTNWTPTISDSAAGHNTDDHANDYWQQAKKTPGGLKSLTYVQRDRLMKHLFDGATVGSDEDAVMDVLKTAPDADARRLINKYGWTYIYDKIDDGIGDPFKDRFPKADYGP